LSGPEYSVMLVHSVSQAIRIERAFGARGIPCRLVPVPRHLSSDCGVSVRLARSDVPAALEELLRRGMEPESIHEV